MKRKFVLAALAAFTVTSVQAAAPAVSAEITPPLLERYPAPRPTAVIRYGTLPRQFGEVRIPRGKGPFPLAMLIHGGCYLKGSATQKNMAGLAGRLQRDGIATWNIDWRELGDDGAGWPGTFGDWAKAAKVIDRIARQYPIDRKRISIVGHSAGATPAIWLASRPSTGDGVRVPALPKFRAIALIDGPLDLTPFVGIDKDICGQPVVVPFLGGTPEQVSARYAAITAVRPQLKGVRQLVISGQITGPKTAARLVQAGTRIGLDMTVLNPPTGDHLSLIYPGTGDFEAVEPALVKFLKD
jgi:alpha/beta superfamily hydrolase